MPFIYYLQVYKSISDNSASWTSWQQGNARLWICNLVNNKQMAFLQIFVSQQLLFLFSKNLDTMPNVTNCGNSQTDLCLYHGTAESQ